VIRTGKVSLIRLTRSLTPYHPFLSNQVVEPCGDFAPPYFLTLHIVYSYSRLFVRCSCSTFPLLLIAFALLLQLSGFSCAVLLLLLTTFATCLQPATPLSNPSFNPPQSLGCAMIPPHARSLTLRCMSIPALWTSPSRQYGTRISTAILVLSSTTSPVQAH